MLFSCLCPTYNREPEILAKVVECFQQQTYKDRELIILNDSPRPLSISKPRVEVINISRRFNTLAEKYIALAGLAKGDYLALWEDDDLYLPNHLKNHSEVLKTFDWSKATKVYQELDGKRRLQEDSDRFLRFHGGIAFTRTAYMNADGWSITFKKGYDQIFLKRLDYIGMLGDPIDIDPEPTYVQRFDISRYSGSRLMEKYGDKWYDMCLRE